MEDPGLLALDPIQAIGDKLEGKFVLLRNLGDRGVLICNSVFNLIALLILQKSCQWCSWAGFWVILFLLGIGKQVLLRRMERISERTASDVPLVQMIPEFKRKVQELLLAPPLGPNKLWSVDADQVRMFCLGDMRPSLDWLNLIIKTLWLNLRAQIRWIVLKELWPASLESVKLHDFHIGDNPVRVVNIMVEPSGPNDLVVDIELAYDGNAFVSVTVSQPGWKVSIPARLQKLKISNLKLRLILKQLIPHLPFFGGLQISLLAEPLIDWETSGVAQIADINLLKSIIRKLVASHIFQKVQNPHRFVLPVGLFDRRLKRMVESKGWPYHRVPDVDVIRPQPLGILRVTVIRAENLRPTDWSLIGGSERAHSNQSHRFAFSDFGPQRVPGDCFVRLSLGQVVRESPILSNKSSPDWNFGADFPVEYCTAHDELTLDLWDRDFSLLGLNSDDHLGRVTERISRVVEKQTLEGWYNCQIYQGRVYWKLEWLRVNPLAEGPAASGGPSGLWAVALGQLKYIGPHARAHVEAIRPQCVVRIKTPSAVLHEVSTHEWALKLKHRHFFNEGRLVRLDNVPALLREGELELEVLDGATDTRLSVRRWPLSHLERHPLRGELRLGTGIDNLHLKLSLDMRLFLDRPHIIEGQPTVVGKQNGLS